MQVRFSYEEEVSQLAGQIFKLSPIGKKTYFTDLSYSSTCNLSCVKNVQQILSLPHFTKDSFIQFLISCRFWVDIDKQRITKQVTGCRVTTVSEIKSNQLKTFEAYRACVRSRTLYTTGRYTYLPRSGHSSAKISKLKTVQCNTNSTAVKILVKIFKVRLYTGTSLFLQFCISLYQAFCK